MIIEGALEAPLFTSEPSDADIAEFQAWVREAGQALYRDLPWRNTRDAYAIWISEAMLQQTQVTRVLSRWERFLRHFPTVDALASASSADVVEEWQGLGYNRRALALKRAADICSAEYAGRMPEGVDKLVKLPGIGDATAAGITAFSRDVPCLYLETNVRAVFIHCFFRDAERVTAAPACGARMPRRRCARLVLRVARCGRPFEERPQKPDSQGCSLYAAKQI